MSIEHATRRADKHYRHRVHSKDTRGINTLCGCFIPWIDPSGNHAATQEPTKVYDKPACPQCEEFHIVMSAMSGYPLEVTDLLEQADQALNQQPA